ncbi:hypothetical protein NDN08_005515 [Rhodosorus marinus]|uniref:Transmembrane protein 53 n=1 Tax=Rhodosorus marinus TaxID=101924 RepID=A0AAV8V1U5_9RHOD|nr:hypothetical protein NDN08_005515 [Rhodosorus marinus]
MARPGFIGNLGKGFGIGGGGGGGGVRCGRNNNNRWGEFEGFSKALIPSVVASGRPSFDGYVGEDVVGERTAFVTQYNSPAFVNNSGRPVVVILSWMGANRKNIEKYTEFYRERGCDVYFFLNNVGHAIIPIESRRQAHRVMETLSSIPQNRPVFVHAFSIGTGVYGYVVDMMRNKEEQFKHVAGVIYDSGPAMIFPSDVAKGLHLVCPTISKKVWSVFAKAFFTVTQARKNFRVAEDALAESQLAHAPQLYVYSKDDTIIDEVHTSIGHFIDQNRRRGIECFSKVFEKSKHVMHLRYHPDEYMENLGGFLQRCLERHDRSFIAGEQSAPAAAH